MRIASLMSSHREFKVGEGDEANAPSGLPALAGSLPRGCMIPDQRILMHKANYDVLTRNGKEKFFIVPVKDFEALLEKLEDEADYRALVKARKASAGKPTYTLDEVKRELGMTRSLRKRQA